jgi:hypothetical protein
VSTLAVEEKSENAKGSTNTEQVELPCVVW